MKGVRFQGKDKHIILERDEYGGQCLISAVDQVLRRLAAENITKVNITEIYREETKLFDMKAAREAFLNAIAHQRRDLPTKPAIYLFSDRIEIISHGGMPQGQTKEKFLKGISVVRNDKLMKILGDFDFAEQSGHGVLDIITAYGEKVIEIDDTYINVTIPFNPKAIIKTSSSSKVDNKVDNKVDIKINETQEKILKIIRNNPNVTISDIMINLKMSKAGISKNYKTLRELNLITREGSQKSGYWKIIE